MSQPAVDVVWEPVSILDAWDETPSLRALLIDRAAIAAHHSAPGQVVRARAASDGHAGYFALASAPSSQRAELLLKRGGAVADAVIAAAARGARLELAAPSGRGFPVEEMRGRDVLLFAAGSGISAIRSLVEHVLAVRPAVGRVTLYYGQSEAADFAYRNEHAAWERAGVEVVLCCSRPGPGWTGARGRVQDVARERGLDGIDPAGAVAYLCGMKAMVAGVRATLAETGLPIERTFLNY
jgi:NAD(P)H-flavin reductase